MSASDPISRLQAVCGEGQRLARSGGSNEDVAYGWGRPGFPSVRRPFLPYRVGWRPSHAPVL